MKNICLLFAFFLLTCSIENNSELQRLEALNDVKTITTIFTSHQADTKQKDGKIVAIVNFKPDGTISEFIEQTTYPYDRDYDVKKEFWDEPNKALLPYIMDGLSLDAAENNLIYGNNWPAKYAKYLMRTSEKENTDFEWIETVGVDDDNKPNEIRLGRKWKNSIEEFSGIIKLYEYEGNKIIESADMHIVPAMNEVMKNTLQERLKKAKNDKEKEEINSLIKMQKPQKSNVINFNYEEDKLASIILSNRKEHKFYYEKDLLIKSEFYVEGKLFNTRLYHYKAGLKEKTEIFNMNSEPEYTITYEYEFW
ncbi:hypothetical protein [Ekhidna sp.]|uniref:hypothetical protein n=1 Tax=Ekhidna sp. TaxID=2608089 RepID=UPI0032EC1A35